VELLLRVCVSGLLTVFGPQYYIYQSVDRARKECAIEWTVSYIIRI